MNVYVVLWAGAPRVFAEERTALAWGRVNGAREVHECPLQGGEAPAPLQVTRHNGHQQQPPPQAPQGAVLGPNGRYVNAQGEELVRQPGPVPENRRAPAGAVRVPPCRVCGAALAANGYCPRCFPQVQAAQVSEEQLIQAVQGWPVNRPAEPTPGAEGM